MRTKLFVAVATIVRKHSYVTNDITTDSYSTTVYSTLHTNESDAYSWCESKLSYYRNRENNGEWTSPDIMTVTSRVTEEILDTDELEEYTPKFTVTLRRTVTMEMEVPDIEADDEDEAGEIATRMHDDGELDWTGVYEDSEEVEVDRIEEVS